MSENFFDATYRQIPDGRMEKILPENQLDLNPENRKVRVDRCAKHIREGHDRLMCRGFIRTEEEWRAACNQSNTEPYPHGFSVYQGGGE